MILPTRLAGEYQVQVLKADRTPRLITHWMPNIVTNFGLDSLLSGQNFTARCSVGTGTATPLATDNQLHELVASTDNRKNASSSRRTEEPWGGVRQVSYEFPLGGVVGNMNEVGVGFSDSALFSRALFVDSNGAPTTITVLDDEILYVTYRVYNYAPVEDQAFTFDMPSGSHSAIVRACRVGSSSVQHGWGLRSEFEGMWYAYAYDGALSDVFTDPTGVESMSADRSTKAYSTGDYYRDMECYWTLGSANYATGISVIRLSTRGLGCYQFAIDPPIMKTAADVLSMSFRISVERA